MKNEELLAPRPAGLSAHRSEVSFELADIGERLRTQDNRITADPIFMVQERIRHYGIDPDYTDNVAWLYEDESVEVDSRTARLFEARYQRTGEEVRGYRRVGYFDTWEHKQPFFTESAADLYIKQNGHNHKGPLRTYAECAFRNWEWQSVRGWLMAAKGPARGADATRASNASEGLEANGGGEE